MSESLTVKRRKGRGKTYWARAAIMSRISPYTARILLSFSLRFSSSSYTALNARIATCGSRSRSSMSASAWDRIRDRTQRLYIPAAKGWTWPTCSRAFMSDAVLSKNVFVPPAMPSTLFGDEPEPVGLNMTFVALCSADAPPCIRSSFLSARSVRFA